MREISFPDQHELVFDRDLIRFPPVVDGKRTMCSITLEEMCREICPADPSTFEKNFRERRPAVERYATQKINEKLDGDSFHFADPRTA